MDTMTTDPRATAAENRLRKLVAESELSYRQLAAQADVHHRTIHSFATGRNGLTLTVALKLADFFGVTLGELTRQKTAV